MKEVTIERAALTINTSKPWEDRVASYGNKILDKELLIDKQTLVQEDDLRKNSSEKASSFE